MQDKYFNEDVVNKVKEEAINDLISILKFETILDEYKPNDIYPFGKENAIALEFMDKLAKKEGFNSKIVDNHAMHIEFNENKEQLCGILAHMDVVPVSDTWTYKPFLPVIEDGKMYARGTVDNKGPIMACFYALKLIKESKLPVSKSVRLIIGSDEESGSRCLTHYFKKETMPDFGFSPDANFPLIHGEKARLVFNLTSDYNGIVTSFNSGQRLNIVPDAASMTLSKDYSDAFKLFLSENNFKGEYKDNTYYAYGISSHASIPNKGLNASYILFKFLNDICDSPLVKYLNEYILFNDDAKGLNINYADKEMGCTTICLGLVNIKDNKATLGFDLRLPYDDKKEDIITKVNDTLKGYPSINIDIDFTSYKRHYVKKDSNLVNTLMKVYKEETNDVTGEPYVIGGGTYASFIPNCVAFGPMLPNREDVIHKDDEYIFIEDYLLLIKIYAKAIYELIK